MSGLGLAGVAALSVGLGMRRKRRHSVAKVD
jgi:hypothetical protein